MNIIETPLHQRALAAATRRESLLLVGPPGCGKTTAGRWIAEKLGLPHYGMAMNPTVDAQDAFGQRTTPAAGLLGYSDGIVLKAYKSGGVVVIDEITSTSPDQAHVWHPVAAREPLLVAASNNNVAIQPVHDYVFIGTTNGNLAGNFQLSP
ncbi:MAG: AAA family ATPase, partial [Vulcanimicrobiaceae bacterium]